MSHSTSMRMRVLAAGLPILLALGSLPAPAQSVPAPNPSKSKFDYDVPVADEPIDSPVFGPRLTFPNSAGGVTVGDVVLDRLAHRGL